MAPSKPKKSRRAFLILLALAVILGSLPAVILLSAPSTGPSTSPLQPDQNIVVDSGYTYTTCVDVETCSVSLSATAYSVVVIGMSEYGTAGTFSTAIHGLTTTSLEAPSTS